LRFVDARLSKLGILLNREKRAAHCSTHNEDSGIKTKDSTSRRAKIFGALRRAFHFETA
jgi:hypothetical protein